MDVIDKRAYEMLMTINKESEDFKLLASNFYSVIGNTLTDLLIWSIAKESLTKPATKVDVLRRVNGIKKDVSIEYLNQQLYKLQMLGIVSLETKRLPKKWETTIMLKPKGDVKIHEMIKRAKALIKSHEEIIAAQEVQPDESEDV